MNLIGGAELDGAVLGDLIGGAKVRVRRWDAKMGGFEDRGAKMWGCEDGGVQMWGCEEGGGGAGAAPHLSSLTLSHFHPDVCPTERERAAK